jgi:hypothetical protein
MPPYNQIHAEYLAYILLGGSALTLLIWLAVMSRRWTATTRKLSEQDYEAEVHSFGDVQEGHRPVPLFLLTMVVLFVLWAIGYTIYSGANYPY